MPSVIDDGKFVYPDSKNQCQYGVEMLAEDAADILIKHCVKKYGPGLVGVCQNQQKQSKGNLILYFFFLLVFGPRVNRERKSQKFLPKIYIYIYYLLTF